jgi:hypothetical protein
VDCISWAPDPLLLWTVKRISKGICSAHSHSLALPDRVLALAGPHIKVHSFYLVAFCYSLDLECSPKPKCQRLGPQLGAVRRWWNLSEVGPKCEILGHWGCALKRDSGNLLSPTCLHYTA